LALVLLHAQHAHADAPLRHYTVTAGTVRDNGTGLTWQQTPDPTPRSWSSADNYCKQLQLSGGGWRLPTLKELLTLVDPARTASPVIDPKAFPDAKAVIYWSSNDYVVDRTYSWTVDFGIGNSAKDHLKSATGNARCVR
jgi:hypothetical protein